MIYSWDEIDNIPSKPGIYAWYYSPEFTDRDINDLLSTLQQAKEENRQDVASEAVKSFIYERIFKYFQEEPYQALLRGALKPQYQGTIEHNPSVTDELIDRIVDQPERLQTIRKVFESNLSLFASPLYIGMSDNLRRRISTHKKLIKKFRENSFTNYYRDSGAYDKPEERDQSFAFQVYKRNFNPTQLSIAIYILDVPNRAYVDIENILNRIHYPMLGRN